MTKEIDKITTIKLKQNFVDWLKSMGVKGDTYQDILFEIIFEQPAEKIENMLIECAYDYHELAKRLGVKLKK